MNFLQRFRKLCTPAAIYFAISAFSLLLIGLQNISNPGRLCLGSYDCPAPGSNNIIVFIGQAIYILFVTYILNLICKDGNENLSWFLVLFPIILMFILFGVTILQMNSMEGMKNNDELVEDFSDDEIDNYEGVDTSNSEATQETEKAAEEMEDELKKLEAELAGFETLQESFAQEAPREGVTIEVGDNDDDDDEEEEEEEREEIAEEAAENAVKAVMEQQQMAEATSVSGFEPMGADANIFG